MNIVWSEGFKRSFKKIIKKNPSLKTKIFEILTLLENDPFSPVLKSHKLTGKLDGLWSCSVAYDCRIIFTFSHDESLAVLLLLIDIGNHDKVYKKY